jgi:hypothetical protein
VGGYQRAVARQAQAQRLGQTVHRIGGKHARARAAGRAGRTFNRCHFFVADLVVCGFNHCIHQVEHAGFAFPVDLAGLHWPAGNKNHRNVQAQRCHQHAGGDLVAVGDAHQRIGGVAIDHVFHRIGDQVAAGQRIQHAAVAHGNAVIDGDGVEFLGDATGFFDLACHQLTHIVQVHVARHKLGEGVGNGNDRLAEIAIFHAGGAPQCAGTSHVAAVGGGAGTISRHDYLNWSERKKEELADSGQAKAKIVTKTGRCAPQCRICVL